MKNEGRVQLDAETKALFGSFGLTDQAKGEVWDAFMEEPAGTIRVAQEAAHFGAKNDNTGAGLFLTMLRRNEHRLKPDPKRRRVTGWRWVRGTHSGTYVPDPHGTDPLPEGYGLDG